MAYAISLVGWLKHVTNVFCIIISTSLLMMRFKHISELREAKDAAAIERA